MTSPDFRPISSISLFLGSQKLVEPFAFCILTGAVVGSSAQIKTHFFVLVVKVFIGGLPFAVDIQ